MEYILENKKYIIHYRELREHYINFCSMSDIDFKNNIKEALHLACVICFFKEIPTEICLSDIGIVHELVHMITIGEENTTTLKEIRELFRQQLELC